MMDAKRKPAKNVLCDVSHDVVIYEILPYFNVQITKDFKQVNEFILFGYFRSDPRRKIYYLWEHINVAKSTVVWGEGGVLIKYARLRALRVGIPANCFFQKFHHMTTLMKNLQTLEIQELGRSVPSLFKKESNPLPRLKSLALLNVDRESNVCSSFSSVEKPFDHLESLHLSFRDYHRRMSATTNFEFLGRPHLQNLSELVLTKIYMDKEKVFNFPLLRDLRMEMCTNISIQHGSLLRILSFSNMSKRCLKSALVRDGDVTYCSNLEELEIDRVLTPIDRRRTDTTPVDWLFDPSIMPLPKLRSLSLFDGDLKYVNLELLVQNLKSVIKKLVSLRLYLKIPDFFTNSSFQTPVLNVLQYESVDLHETRWNDVIGDDCIHVIGREPKKIYHRPHNRWRCSKTLEHLCLRNTRFDFGFIGDNNWSRLRKLMLCGCKCLNYYGYSKKESTLDNIRELEIYDSSDIDVLFKRLSFRSLEKLVLQNCDASGIKWKGDFKKMKFLRIHKCKQFSDRFFQTKKLNCLETLYAYQWKYDNYKQGVLIRGKNWSWKEFKSLKIVRFGHDLECKLDEFRGRFGGMVDVKKIEFKEYMWQRRRR